MERCLSIPAINGEEIQRNATQKALWMCEYEQRYAWSKNNSSILDVRFATSMSPERPVRGWKVMAEKLVVYRRIFVYTLCLINICFSLSDDSNKIKTLNIERT